MSDIQETSTIIYSGANTLKQKTVMDLLLCDEVIMDVVTTVDNELNDESTNPIQNSLVSKSLNDIRLRINEIEYINSIRLDYTTNLEVFPTLDVISAGEKSSKEAYIERMFVQTNIHSTSNKYTERAVVTKYSSSETSTGNVGGDIKIYKALKDVPENINLTDAEYWLDITDIYLYRDTMNNRWYHRYIESVEPSSIQILKITSTTEPIKQSTYINWGDGATTKLNKAKPRNINISDIYEELSKENPIIVEQDNNGYIYWCYYDYADSLMNDGMKSKYYTISIMGNKFQSISSGRENIISNIFGDNLHFYFNCTDIEGLLKNSKKILYVSCSDYNNAILCIHNVKELFEGCTNLQYAIGFYELTGVNTMVSMERMFANCINMLNCDVRIAKSTSTEYTGNKEVFLNCENMSSRLRTLLPSNGFDSRVVSLISTFQGCKSIYVKNITSNYIEQHEPKDTEHIKNILFNDESKIFNIECPFLDCNLLYIVDDFVPEDWR